MQEDRYTRQRRLREIGDGGQERLANARVVVRGGADALLELVYLHRAGVGTVALDALGEPRAFPHARHFRHATAARHAAAAWRALSRVVELAVSRGSSERSAGAVA